jgi:hypothetical protein
VILGCLVDVSFIGIACIAKATIGMFCSRRVVSGHASVEDAASVAANLAVGWTSFRSVFELIIRHYYCIKSAANAAHQHM